MIFPLKMTSIIYLKHVNSFLKERKNPMVTGETNELQLIENKFVQHFYTVMTSSGN